MYCPNCGKKVENDHHFCFVCGYKLPVLSPDPQEPVPELVPEAPIPVQEPETVMESVVKEEPEAISEPEVPAEPAPKQGRLWVPIVAMAILACLGLALFFFGPQGELPYLTISQGAVTFHADRYTGGPELTIPSQIDGQTVTAIADGGFRNCGLEAIYLPETLTAIGSEAFADSDYLRGIYIPGSVTKIGDGAFRDCDGLEAIYLPGTLEALGEDSLSSCDILKYILFNGTYAQWTELYSGRFASRVELHAVDGTYYTHP